MGFLPAFHNWCLRRLSWSVNCCMWLSLNWCHACSWVGALRTIEISLHTISLKQLSILTLSVIDICDATWGFHLITNVFQHLVVRVLENDGCDEAPSQRRASWRRADSDMIKRVTMCQV